MMRNEIPLPNIIRIMEEYMQLDRTDFALIRLLRNNARTPNNALAEQAGIAASTALQRVRHLQASGAILGYHAEVAPAAVGIGLQAMVAARLTRHSRALVESFHHHPLSLPAVLSLYHLTGADDFLVHIGVREAGHLCCFSRSAFHAIPEMETMY